nr:MAG: putative RNA-dependent RNA polymerase [Picobirnaviridae sp.]
MKEIPYMIKEIIQNYRKILSEARKLPNPLPLTEEQKAEGIRVSKMGSSAPKEVPMTPLMSEILRRTKEKTNDKWRLSVDAPTTKGEKWVDTVTKQLLAKFNGPETTKYDESLPIDSFQHYNVGCWRNYKKNLRDVQPGQDKQRVEMAERYSRATQAMDLISKLEHDEVFQKAVMLVCDALPSVKANNEWNLVSQPFMNKDANVTYPFFRNDRAVDPKTGKTYGQLSVELAKKVGLKNVYNYNYTTMFGRNQKGKGRLICATSRVPNVIFNQLEAEEIKAYREKSPLFVGYKDDKGLKEALIKMKDQCLEHGLKCRNVDQNKYDLHVNEAFIILVAAISMMKANGSKSKEIALKRGAMMTKTWLINGLTDKVMIIYGRIFSGFIDTNRGGGIINAIAVLYGVMDQNPDHSKWVYMLLYWMLVMGDDNLFVYKNLDYNKFKETLKSIGFDVEDSKDEYGLFFLQYRLFKPASGQDHVMCYPWPRVLRSLLMKEMKKGLGKYGWELAWWQQISKCIEYPEALSILVNFVAYLDEEKLCLNMPIGELLQKVEQEDREAMSKLNTSNQKSKFTSTFDKLSDGDPQKVRFGESEYLANLQKKMREVYDPNFWNRNNLVNLL